MNGTWESGRNSKRKGSGTRSKMNGRNTRKWIREILSGMRRRRRNDEDEKGDVAAHHLTNIDVVAAYPQVSKQFIYIYLVNFQLSFFSSQNKER